MLRYIALAFIALIFTYAFNTYRAFSKNLKAAKDSNIPYVIVPWYMFSLFWLLTHRIFLPWLRKLPKSVKGQGHWIDLVDLNWCWHHLFAKWEELGTDSFLTVAPGGLIYWTANAESINQITTRRNDFPKPIGVYGSLDVFGKNVVTTEGHLWRQHRKIVSPPFTEKNNHIVWLESLHQAQSMLKSWSGSDGQDTGTITSVAADTMRLSLHVISRAGFGVRLVWPGIEDGASDANEASKPAEEQAKNSIGMSAGHTMTYTDALDSLLSHLPWVMLLPRFILKNAPFKPIQVAYKSFVNWDQYMKEMFEAKKVEVLTGDGDTEGGMDLMGALVKGAGITSTSEKGQKSPQQALSDAEILGNCFVFILAGHETAANSIHFSLVCLAMELATQRRLQSDLDDIFQGRPIGDWRYERDLPKLFGGMAGAVLNEELRLFPPVVGIPKSTLHDASPQTLSIDGKKCTIPSGTFITLASAAVHRNPKYWPTGPRSNLDEPPVHPRSNTDNDLEEFKPERWFLDSVRETHDIDPIQNMSSHHDAPDDLNVDSAPDTSASFFHPPKGAYIPFSEGHRACIGRRFAQVQVLAVLAVIFSQYSVELAVDEWASDLEVARMSQEEKKQVWGKARQKTRRLMTEGMESRFTLQMRGGKVPLRFVRRGEERFAW